MINLFDNNCLDVFAAIRDNSISAIVTDPPYGLNFMQTLWDKGVPGIEFWKEMLRISKPGAFLLAFGGTKTHHRLMCAIEDAGWELRDCMCWLYGSGFPKSYSISKNIDRKLGKKREVIGKNIHHRPNHDLQNTWRNKENRKASPMSSEFITAPASEEAKKWKGYGTALKPSWEPIIVAMKPIDKNFVNNALNHGVGGLNIDKCRIGVAKDKESSSGRWPTNVILNHHPECIKLGYKSVKSNGHWIAPSKKSKFLQLKSYGGRDEKTKGKETIENWQCHIECPIKLLDRQSGQLKSGKIEAHHHQEGYSKIGTFKIRDRTGMTYGYGDSGGASRFYYCAKASPSERRPYNNHCTVKPLAVIEYLIKLVTYPDYNLILDPFMGSGTAGIVCKKLGIPFIGIENDKDNFKTAKKRINDPWFYQTEKEREQEKKLDKKKKEKQDKNNTNIPKIF